MDELDKLFTKYYASVEEGYDILSNTVANIWLVIQNVVFAMIIFPLWLIGKVSKKQD